MFVNSKNKKRIFIKTILIVFASVLLAGSFYVVPAKAASDDIPECATPLGKPVCPQGEDGIKLQIGIPFVGEVCKYTVKDSSSEEKQKMLYCVSGFPAYVKGFYDLFIAIVGILAVVMIMIGGFRWLLAGGNAQKIDGAKSMLISAIMGMVLAMASYAILDMVNSRIVDLNLTTDVIQVTGDIYDGLSSCTSIDEIIYPNDKYPECGTVYTTQDGKCIGKGCEMKAAYSSFYSEPCVGYGVNYDCGVGSLFINDERPDGFGAREWEKGISSSNIPNPACGELLISVGNKKDQESSKNHFVFGTGCPSTGELGTCVIGIEEGADFNDLTWDDVVKAPDNRLTGVVVGKLNNAYCNTAVVFPK